MPITQTEQEIKDKYVKFHETLTSCYYQPKGRHLGYPNPTEEEVNELEAWAGQEIAEVRSPVITSIGLQQFNQIHGNIHSEMDSLLIAGGFLEPPPTPGPYIDTNEIVDQAVTEPKIPPDALTHIAVGEGAIRESELADDAVTRGKIADAAVSRGKIEDGAINRGKIADGEVTRLKVNDGAVSQEKLDAEVKYWQLQRLPVDVHRWDGVFPSFNWTDVDLDTNVTVPDGAVAIIMNVRLSDATGTPVVFLRCNHERGKRYQSQVRLLVAGTSIQQLVIVPFDKGHIIEVMMAIPGIPAGSYINLYLAGWVMEPGA